MSEIAISIILIPLGALLYVSGLLLWPVRRWLRRKHPIRGRALAIVSIAQVASYAGVGFLAALRPQLMGHGYYWCIILIELNVLFTFAGAIAWARDSVYEQARHDKCRTSR